MLNRQRKLNEDVAQQVFKVLFERFGEPIVGRRQTVGIRDERSSIKDEDDVLNDKQWSEYQKQRPSVAEALKAGHHTAMCDEDCDETHDLVDETTPPGYEKIVKKLKRSKSVKNPWAVAWSMKKKGIKPKS